MPGSAVGSTTGAYGNDLGNKVPSTDPGNYTITVTGTEEAGNALTTAGSIGAH